MSNFKYGIISAMREETQKIKEALNLQSLKPGIYYRDNICLIESGIGKTASAFATTRLIYNCEPEKIINIGLCGAVDNDLEIGETLFVSDVYQADAYKPFPGYEDFVAHIKPKHPIKVKTARLATVDHFVDRIDDTLGFTLDADIVDMEGYSVAYVCRQFGIDCYLIKSVSDYCDHDSKTDLYTNLETAMNNSIAVLKEVVQ